MSNLLEQVAGPQIESTRKLPPPHLRCACGNKRASNAPYCFTCRKRLNRPPVDNGTFVNGKGIICRKIALTQGQYATINVARYDEVAPFSWFAIWSKKMKGYYASACIRDENGKWRNVYLHRFITGIKDPRIKVDHIDKDTLNNTEENLRPATHAKNMSNSKLYSSNTSGYRGVYRQSSGRYGAVVGYNGKHVYAGTYSSIISAAKARDKKAQELHGEFVVLNFPDHD